VFTGTTTVPDRRTPFPISNPAIELNDMIATRSPASQPRLMNTLAARLALRFSDEKSRVLSPRITAGFEGSDSAWLARKSNSAIGTILGR